jgi:hypothetical protein
MSETHQHHLEIMAASQFSRLRCLDCESHDTLVAREVTFYPEVLPLARGNLRLQVQLTCNACKRGKRFHLQLYEQPGSQPTYTLERDDPYGDHEAKITWLDQQ